MDEMAFTFNGDGVWLDYDRLLPVDFSPLKGAVRLGNNGKIVAKESNMENTVSDAFGSVPRATALEFAFYDFANSFFGRNGLGCFYLMQIEYLEREEVDQMTRLAFKEYEVRLTGHRRGAPQINLRRNVSKLSYEDAICQLALFYQETLRQYRAILAAGDMNAYRSLLEGHHVWTAVMVTPMVAPFTQTSLAMNMHAVPGSIDPVLEATVNEVPTENGFTVTENALDANNNDNIPIDPVLLAIDAEMLAKRRSSSSNSGPITNSDNGSPKAKRSFDETSAPDTEDGQHMAKRPKKTIRSQRQTQPLMKEKST